MPPEPDVLTGTATAVPDRQSVARRSTDSPALHCYAHWAAPFVAEADFACQRPSIEADFSIKTE
ncbi:hypothetical protein GCM10010295_44260 [Streptomyces intermedius]